MKIFQLIDWITRLFKLNKKAKTVTLLLLSYSMYGQNNAMFWGSQFNKATNTSVSYFLDEQPNAIAAYSLRRLSSAYTGPLIEIRRTSNNSRKNIGFDNDGNLDVAEIISHCSGGTCTIATWYDQSGNSKNITSSLNNNEPYIYLNNNVLSNSDNHYGILTSESETKYLITPFPKFSLNDFTISVVATQYQNNDNLNSIIFNLQATTSEYQTLSATKLDNTDAFATIYSYSNQYNFSNILDGRSYHYLISRNISELTTKLSVGNYADITGTTNSSTFSADLWIGAYYYFNSSTLQYITATSDKLISEIILWNTNKYDERSNIKQNISNYYTNIN